MGMTPPATWPAELDHLRFAPNGYRLRTIKADDDDTKAECGTTQIAEAVNYLLCNHRQREYSTVFVDDLTWTDVAYAAGNQIAWRQPVTPGFVDCTYRFHARTDGAAGEIRVQGVDAIWHTVAVAAGGAWQDVTITDVDQNTASEYFSPILQGEIPGSGTLQIRTMGWIEQALAAVPTTGIDMNGDGNADTWGADDTETFDDDEPLSAGAMEEIGRACLNAYDHRSRIHVCRMLADGSGAHTNNEWTTLKADYPDPINDREATNTVARFIVNPDEFKPRTLQIHVEARSDGAKEGGIQFADKYGNTAELTWAIGENANAWKSTTLGPIHQHFELSPDSPGTEIFVSLRDALTVRTVLVFSGDEAQAL